MMAAVVSLGELQEVQRIWSPGIYRGSVNLYDRFNYDYAALYRTQPNVRTCVDFLARNVAQLGLHVFRRVSETDRVRLREHALSRLLARPVSPPSKVTRYRLVESTMSDLGIYFNAYWLKLRNGDGRVIGLLRLPPMYVTSHGGLVVTSYELVIGGKRWDLDPANVVHFYGYNPENAISGLSPLETLRRVLAEEHASGRYREAFWQNAARQSGIIRRPADAPEWSDEARERFLAEFANLYSGDENSGKTAVLEEGMEWQPITFSAEESEYLAGRKLTREECARAYHIPLPMVGILDNAHLSNIREQHRNLYQDSLGPWLAMIEQDIELQLLPDLGDADGVYVEFNIAEKLSGSFEEQTSSLQASVGRPWMTANEARARMNLPSLAGDADALVTPLNVLVGGLASPQDTAPGTRAAPLGDAKALELKVLDSHLAELRGQHEKKWTEVLQRHYRRQEAAIASRVPKATAGNGHETKADIGGVWYDEERWNTELAADLFRLNRLTAVDWAAYIAGQLEAELDEDMMLSWLEEHSRIQAAYLNGQVRDGLIVALNEPEPVGAVHNLFLLAAGTWAISQAISAVTTAANFGASEGARAGGMRRKTWRVNSSNPRPAHKAMNGETVGIGDKFSNGGRWPGDPALGAEDNANCMCSVVFSR